MNRCTNKSAFCQPPTCTCWSDSNTSTMLATTCTNIHTYKKHFPNNFLSHADPIQMLDGNWFVSCSLVLGEGSCSVVSRSRCRPLQKVGVAMGRDCLPRTSHQWSSHFVHDRARHGTSCHCEDLGGACLRACVRAFGLRKCQRQRNVKCGSCQMLK